MIAYRGECDSQLLLQLLHASLSRDEETLVTKHLERCESCRLELDKLTAPDAWWRDTQLMLKDASSLGTPVDTVSHPQVDHSVAWVVKLLKPSNAPNCIGVLDHWPVREVIGHGGMGVVLKVWDDELHRPLAVKLLSPMLASNGASRQRFFREAQAAAAVVHPNIVPIYTVATESALPYLVMPFVAGGNLQQRIDREGSLPLTEILSIGVQIAEALVAAHRLGLVHRDIKPANILLDDGGHRVLLSDFGLARTIDDASLTNSGMVAGTPQYMSPEQARGMSIDHRSDLYSLGAVLYAMATGRPPVRGESTLAILRLVGEEQPIPVYELNETMPLWMEKLIRCFLEKKVESRVSNATEAVDLLRSALAHARAPGRNPLPKAFVSSSQFAWIQTSLLTTLLIAMLAVGYAVWPKGRHVASTISNSNTSVAPMATTNSDQQLDSSLQFESDVPHRLMRMEIEIQSLKSSLQDVGVNPEGISAISRGTRSAPPEMVTTNRGDPDGVADFPLPRPR